MTERTATTAPPKPHWRIETELAPVAMLVARSDSHVIGVNQLWTQLSGLDPDASLGCGWLRVIEPADRARLLDELTRVARADEQASADFRLDDGRGRRWSRWWLRAHHYGDDTLVVIAVADVDADYAREAELRHLATHDLLTGLANRSMFFERLKATLSRARRDTREVSVVYLDLDRFKEINDTLGHRAGDIVLVEVARRIEANLRAEDLVARMGGDEFTIAVEHRPGRPTAIGIVRRILMALGEPVAVAERKLMVGASVGIASSRGDIAAGDLLHAADLAMYKAKKDGGSRCVAFEDLASGPRQPVAPSVGSGLSVAG